MLRENNAYLCAFTLLLALFINPSRQFTARQFPFDIKVVVRSIYISSYLVRTLNFSDLVVTTRSFTIIRTSLGLSMHTSQVVKAPCKKSSRARTITEGTLTLSLETEEQRSSLLVADFIVQNVERLLINFVSPT